MTYTYEERTNAVTNLKSISDDITAACIDKNSRYVFLKSEIDKRQWDINSIEKNIQNTETFIDIMELALLDLTNTAKTAMEQIITHALCFITNSTDYSFVIQEKTIAGVLGYEFLVKSVINGKEVLQDPISANGGGFIDIISVSLRIAYLLLFNEPRLFNTKTVYMDEPGKMLSSEYSIRFGEYLKYISKSFGLQIIMITHNENLINIADKTISIEKNNQGVSQLK